MTEPPSRINGSAFCTVKSVPRALRSKVASKFSSVIFPSSSGSTRPELATRMSRPPFSSRTVANSLSRSALFEASPATVVTPSPISALALSNSLSRRPLMKTYAPSCANLCAVASPIPLLPPVITATLPFSRDISSSSISVLWWTCLCTFALRQRCHCAEIVVAAPVSGAGWKGVAEHGQSAFGVFPCCFVLDDIPMFGGQTVFDTNDGCHDPVVRLADIGESAVQHHMVAVGDDQRVLVAHVWR